MNLRSPRKTVTRICCALVLLAVCPAGISAQEVESTRCHDSILESPPRWISSAVFHDGVRGPLIVDPLRNLALAYGPDGRVQASFSGDSDTLLATVQKWSSQRYVMKLVGTELLILSEGLETEERLDLIQIPAPTGARVGSLYEWSMAGRELVSYGVVLTPEDDMRLGFFRLNLAEALQGADSKNTGSTGSAGAVAIGPLSSLDMLKDYDAHEYYRLGLPLVSSVQDSAFFVAMRADEDPLIYRCGPAERCRELTRLADLDAKLSDVPSLTAEEMGFSEAESLFEKIETMTIAAGLFGWEGNLYLLTRQPDEDGQGKTVWQLHPIDPETGGALRKPWILPLKQAHHLTVVPGPDFWYFFIRGKVDRGGQQPIRKMRLIDSDIFRTTPVGSQDRDLSDLNCNVGRQPQR